MASYQQTRYPDLELTGFAVRGIKKLNYKLGEGFFGSVEKFLIEGGRYVSGKTYQKSSLYLAGANTDAVMRRFKSECQLLSQIKHPNIVEFIGIFFFQEYAPTLMTEYMPCNLEKFINKPEDIHLHLKLHILNQITRGLVFLHSCTPPLVHRDLTSNNIMLSEDAAVVRIADIRNILIVDPEKVTEVMQSNPVARSYMPPEVTTLTSPLQCGMPVDIFSFGHLALYTMIKQFPGNLPPKVCKDVTYTELERRRVYLNILKNMMDNKSPIVDIIERCLKDLPNMRPGANEVMEHINCQLSLESTYENRLDDGGVNTLLKGEPDTLEMYTVGWLRRAGWKNYEFQLKESLLICNKTSKKEVIAEVPLSSITTVENEDSKLHSDKSKFYFKISFHGKQPPWLLRTCTELKRFNWITAISQSMQAGHHTPTREASFSQDDVPVLYQQGLLSTRVVKRDYSLNQRNSPKLIPERRFSTPLFNTITTGEDKDTAINPSYDSHQKRRSMFRKADDALPSLPPTKESQDEALYDEVLDVAHAHSEISLTQLSDNENKYDDIIHKTEEEKPPPIPPKKMKARQPSVLHMTRYVRASSSEDEEGYVSVMLPVAGSSTEPSDTGPPGSYDSATSQSTSTETPGIPTVVPAITYSQSSSDNEESPRISFISDETMDAVEHSRLVGSTRDHISLGNLSSLEVTSPQVPRIIPSVEHYFYFLQQQNSALYGSNQRLSPIQSEDGSHYAFDQDSTESENEESGHFTKKQVSAPHCSPTSAAIAFPVGTSNSNVRTSDKLQHQSENRSSPNVAHSSPSKHFLATSKPRQQYFPHSQQHSISTSPQRSFFSPDESCTQPMDSLFAAEQPRDPIQSQTYMLQKMQQALEAMQAAYAYMPPYISQETESLTTKAQNNSCKMADKSQHEQSSSSKFDSARNQIPTVSVDCPKGKAQVPETQVLMQQCLKELLFKTPVIFSDKLLVTGENKEVMPPELKKLARANSEIGDSSAPLNTLQREANYITGEQLFNVVPIKKGQFSTQSTASLRQHGSDIRVLVTSIQVSKGKEEQKKFFQQQAAIAEMIHPNIARHFAIRNEESPMIVSEILLNGDLKTFLQNNDCPEGKLLNFMLDVSMGMHYLAQKGLVHRNIAARSIMVDQNEKCKISNFTHLMHIKDSSTDILYGDLLSLVRWMAPESIVNKTKKQFSTASDVWSFGILQWEMKNPNSEPYEGLTSEELMEREFSRIACLQIPKDYPTEIKNIMKACWQQDPSQRPSFLLIAKIITNLI